MSQQSQLEHAHRVKDERSAEALAAKRNAADLEQKVPTDPHVSRTSDTLALALLSGAAVFF